MTRRIEALLAACLCLAAVAPAAEVKISIDPHKTLNQVDEKVYGHFLEHIYHSVNGGLWGNLIWDRSFEGGARGEG